MAEGFNDWAFDLRPSIKANQGITLEAIELPDSYKETCLFLMAVEPYLLHATWDVAPEVFEELQVHGHDNLHPVRFILRFYDVTGINFNGENSRASFDVEVDVDKRKRYVPLRNPGGAYLAEIGTVNGTGSFSLLARSNVTETPRAGTSPSIEPQFTMVQEVAAQENFVTEVPSEPLAPARLRAEQENVPDVGATPDDDVDLPADQETVPATALVMKEEEEKTLPAYKDNAFSIRARDVLLRANLFHFPPSHAEPEPRPGIFATRVIEEQGWKGTGVGDLTEKCEKMFVTGISSK